MGIDITALTTNADKLGECIDKNKKREQDRKDEQLYGIIERKVKKEEHKREKPRSRDGTLKECKRLFEKDASPEVLTKLEESLREQEKYYRYYVQCFLPVLDEVIERSKKTPNETKERVKQAISEITYNSKYCNQNDRRNSEDSEAESGYGSDAGDDYEKHLISNPNTANEDQEVEKSNGITNNNVQLLKAIKNENNRKFKKHLKDCTDISSLKDKEGKNILHLIASLKKKQKRKFLGTLIKTVTEEDLAQLINSENQDALQVALINKITKEKHESHTIQDNDNTLKFLTKLLEHGASSDNLGLSTKELQGLKEEQKTYYRNFLEKLAKQGKKSKLKPKIRANTEAKIKEIIPHTINTPDSNDNYQLHLAIKNNDKERFEELLQKGADISLKDTDGNNALHYIASFKGEQKVACLELISDKDRFSNAVNTTSREGLTPLHHLLQHIKEKNEDRSCTDRKFEKTNRYKALKLFLQNGADITVQDKDKKNALHYIASFKGEQKISCWNLILDLVEKGVISSEKLHKAINAQNEDYKYPAQVALIRQANKIPSKLKDFSRWSRSRPTKHYYTAEFCTELLQNGAENKSDHITIPKEHRKQKYYQTTKRIKDLTGVSPNPETQKELEELFSKKNGRKNISLPVKWILGGLIFATVFSALAGNMVVAAILSVTIAVCAMCYPAYLKLENALNARNPVAQKPSEHAENPATKMSDISTLPQSMNKLVGNVL